MWIKLPFDGKSTNSVGTTKESGEESPSTPLSTSITGGVGVLSPPLLAPKRLELFLAKFHLSFYLSVVYYYVPSTLKNLCPPPTLLPIDVSQTAKS